MELVLGIDLGTSNFKLGLFDREGRQRGLGRADIHADRGPDGSLCELPVEGFHRAFVQALEQALSQAQATPGQIRGVSYACQANSFLLLDAQCRPLTPIVLWPDARAGQCDEAITSLWRRPDFLQVTGFGAGALADLMVAKLRWFQRSRPELWRQVRHVMTVSDYLTHCLTGEAVGDAGTASMLALLDQRSLTWWPAALECLELDERLLSRPLPPGTRAGSTWERSAELLGIPSGIPVAIGGMDHHIAAVGAGLGTLGQVSESTGTVLACVRYTARFAPEPGEPRQSTYGPGLAARRHYQLNWDENGAGVLAWYRRMHAPELTFPQLLKLAEDLPHNAALPVARPRADRFDGLRGFEGEGDFGHGHFVRAILNSTAESLDGLIGSFFPDGPPARVVATGGGARSDLWLRTYADRVGAEFVATASEEPACLGAAMLAGVAAGWFDNPEQAGREWVRIRKAFSPNRR